MDKKKKDALTGLAIGLICLIVLWWFRFDRMEFVDGYMFFYSPIGDFIYGITKSMMSDVISAERNRARNFWFITQFLYVGAVWYYRACIGHWFYKIIGLVYKKI